MQYCVILLTDAVAVWRMCVIMCIQDTGAHIKVYTECAPLSTERIVQINGSPRVIVKCFSTIFDIVQTVHILSPV